MALGKSCYKGQDDNEWSECLFIAYITSNTAKIFFKPIRIAKYILSLKILSHYTHVQLNYLIT